jgi:hypothetical protein
VFYCLKSTTSFSVPRFGKAGGKSGLKTTQVAWPNSEEKIKPFLKKPQRSRRWMDTQ